MYLSCSAYGLNSLLVYLTNTSTVPTSNKYSFKMIGFKTVLPTSLSLFYVYFLALKQSATLCKVLNFKASLIRIKLSFASVPLLVYMISSILMTLNFCLLGFQILFCGLCFGCAMILNSKHCFETYLYFSYKVGFS